MPTTYVPKSRPVTAVRLKADLLVEAGQWLIIDEDDVVSQLSPRDFESVYVMPTTRPVLTPTIEVVRPKHFAKGKSALNRTVDGVLTSQPGRIFFHLRSIGHPAHTSDLYPLITNEVDQHKSSISAALCVLRDLDLITSEKDPDGSNLNVWSVNEWACDRFDELGFQCFEKNSLQIPPLNTMPGIGWRRPGGAATVMASLNNGKENHAPRARME